MARKRRAPAILDNDPDFHMALTHFHDHRQVLTLLAEQHTRPPVALSW
jgi:hypothetical protein